MSATVRLSAKLPGDPEINGLDAHKAHLFDQEQVTCALVWVVPTKVTEDLATGERVPTVEIRRIEPIGRPEDIPSSVVELAAKLYEKRTGRDPLPIDALLSPSGEVRDLGEDDDDDEPTVPREPRISREPSRIGEIFSYGDKEDEQE